MPEQIMFLTLLYSLIFAGADCGTKIAQAGQRFLGRLGARDSWSWFEL